MLWLSQAIDIIGVDVFSKACCSSCPHPHSLCHPSCLLACCLLTLFTRLFLHIACIHHSPVLAINHHQLTAHVTVHSRPSLLAQALGQDITTTDHRVCLSRSSLIRGSYPSKTHWARDCRTAYRPRLDSTTQLERDLLEQLLSSSFSDTDNSVKHHPRPIQPHHTHQQWQSPASSSSAGASFSSSSSSPSWACSPGSSTATSSPINSPPTSSSCCS